MKRFSKWEEREDRKMRADLRQQQPGVLFLDEPEPNPLAHYSHDGVLQVLFRPNICHNISCGSS
jgi:hypothetical protein